LLGSFAQGQNLYGRITGRVTDATGAFAPNASVRATHLDTGVSTASRSNPEGNYELPNLIPGVYRITVELAGFKRYERTAVEVRVGDVLNVPVQLEVGQVAESVTVSDEAPLLESASASLGQVVDSRRIMDLPVPGASLLYLTTLMPGVFSLQAPTYPYTPNTLGGSSDIGAAGTRARSGEFTMDGIPAMTRSGQIAVCTRNSCTISGNAGED
jgi:hypothetical protein